MFNFGGITHVIRNPKGHAEGYEFSLVGSVPLAMMEPRKPTTARCYGRSCTEGWVCLLWPQVEHSGANQSRCGESRRASL